MIPVSTRDAISSAALSRLPDPIELLKQVDDKASSVFFRMVSAATISYQIDPLLSLRTTLEGIKPLPPISG